MNAAMDFVRSANTFTSSYVEDDDVANVILVDQFSNSVSASGGNEKFENINASVLFIFATPGPFTNFSLPTDIPNGTEKDAAGYRDSLSIILPISICYFLIFVTGILGNVITCVVIAKNKTMHTATNYYLFNLAVSDFFVLIFGKLSFSRVARQVSSPLDIGEG